MSEVPLYLDACLFDHLPLPLTGSSQVQGYLDHKKQPPPRERTFRKWSEGAVAKVDFRLEI